MEKKSPELPHLRHEPVPGKNAQKASDQYLEDNRSTTDQLQRLSKAVNQSERMLLQRKVQETTGSGSENSVNHTDHDGRLNTIRSGAEIVQQKLVALPNGKWADDQDPESRVNDGTEELKLIGVLGDHLFMEDDTGFFSIYNKADGKKKNKEQLKAMVRSFHTRIVMLRADWPNPKVQMAFREVLQDHPDVIKASASYLEQLAPDLIAYKPKSFARSASLTLTPAKILGGSEGQYEFRSIATRVSVRYSDKELGYITLTAETNAAPIKVGELEVSPAYRGMNISRVLMVMLAQRVKRGNHHNYSVGQDTEITNKGFWNQYSTHAAPLLARGDHQKIDVPANPEA